jgi:hypothetical protein
MSVKSNTAAGKGNFRHGISDIGYLLHGNDKKERMD